MIFQKGMFKLLHAVVVVAVVAVVVVVLSCLASTMTNGETNAEQISHSLQVDLRAQKKQSIGLISDSPAS